MQKPFWKQTNKKNKNRLIDDLKDLNLCIQVSNKNI